MPNSPASRPLLEVRGLSTHFVTDEGVARANDGVDFTVLHGRTLCLVGESGSGKSIAARALLQIVGAPGLIVAGEMLFERSSGEVVDLARLSPKSAAMRAIRGREIAMIFQEPMSSLAPIHTIGSQIAAAVRLHLGMSDAEAREHAVAMLRRVNMPRPEAQFDRYPFQLSGGMRQRAMIALALSCNPRLLIADEPTTALDVTTQAVILELLKEIQQKMEMAVIFITHDLGVVAEIADDVAVMYLGRVVERGPVEQIFDAPAHPYTRALLRSLPRHDSSPGARLELILGSVPDAYHRPPGCPFHHRCPEAMLGVCDIVVPAAKPLPDNGEVRCLLHEPEQIAKALARRAEEAVWAA